MSPRSRADKPLTDRGYSRLLADLQKLLAEGKARAEAAVGRELVRTYHAVGSRIAKERLVERAGYGSAILAELADGLDLHPRVLQRALAFARLYPEPPVEREHLRWAHYQQLLRVKDAAARSWYEEQAEAGRWTYRKLAEAINQSTHRLQLETSAKAHKPHPALSRPREATYVYKAKVERVIDGDTLLMLIDLGFHVLKRQRVRLARIDTPPLRQKKGKAAQAYVRDTLAQVDFVVVKTNKVDLYGRYVGHVFFAAAVEDEQRVFAKGRYLNEELVQKGLAKAL